MEDPQGGRSANSPASAERAAVATSGILASLLMHGFLCVPLLWGAQHRHHRQPDLQGSSASQNRTNSLQPMTVIFVDDSDAIHDLSDAADDQKPILMPQPPLLPIARPRVALLSQLSPAGDDSESAIEAKGDQAGHAMLFGRYMGQISARVERAWIRPRTPLAATSFACRVEISQDRSGNVQEVTLQECNDDPRWQVSLVQAIQSASPFPAPPDPAVFSNLLTVEFDSEVYVAGRGSEGFEPERRPDAEVADPSMEFVHQRSGLGRSSVRTVPPGNSIQLTIIGNPDRNSVPDLPHPK